MRIKTVAAVVTTTLLATFTTAHASTEPATTEPVATTEVSIAVAIPETTSEVVTEEVTTVAEAVPSTETSAPVVTELAVTSTENPVQVVASQEVVITATVVAEANSGGNVVVEPPQDEGAPQPAEVDTGDATAVGSDDTNVINQAADIVLREDAQANVVQVALILNIGVAFANSGGNIVGAGGGGGSAGQVGTGNASATGLDIGQYITQGAREGGNANTDAASSQIAISLWMGVAGSNTGGNMIAGPGVTAGSGGSVGAGSATAIGNQSLTEISQYAGILGVDASTINVNQQATVLNVGFALANSGINDVGGVASGLLTAAPGDDDAIAQELFAMLLPALLQSYGYGPAAGAISTGDATAVGNSSETFIRQVALAASSGDGQVDIVQRVLVANVGAATANTGGNTLGSVRVLDADTANAVVTMAAFMSELLALVHHQANDTAFEARSMGIEIPFQGLILRLDGSFQGLDTAITNGGSSANLRQVSIVISLGIANANTGGNVSQTQIAQGNTVNGLQTGDAVAVIGTGDATATNEALVVVCQRINAEDIACLEPPESTTVPTTTDPATSATTTPPSGSTSTNDPAGGISPSTSTSSNAQTASGFGHVPQGPLPATGTTTTLIVVFAIVIATSGGAILLIARKRNQA